MINYKFSYIFISFGIFLMIKLIPFDKIFSKAVELLFEHAISFFSGDLVI